MKSRLNQLADLLRTGQGTPEMEIEYEQLLAEHKLEVKRYSSIYELPMAKAMWQADAQAVERR